MNVLAASRADLTADASAALAVLDDPVEQRRFTRSVTASDGRALAESSLQLSGMHCAACAGLIEHALAGVPGVVEARVSAAAQRALVRWDPQRTRVSALVQAIRGAGYDAAPDTRSEARALRAAEARSALWRLFVAGLCGMQVMMLATPIYVAGEGGMAADLRQLLNWGSWVLTLPVLLFSAWPFLHGAAQALRRRRINMDVPVAIGIVVTFIASTGAAFDPGGVFGHEVYFDSLAMFVAFLLGARWLEMRGRHRAAEALEATLAALPETALRVAADGSVQSVSAQRLVAGDRVRVPVGQAFPADGTLLAGATEVDEALLSGESRPQPRGAGEGVLAGSVNLGAPVEMRVDRAGEHTRQAAIAALVRDAMTQRPALARMADRWAAPFLWSVLALAAAGAAAWSVIDPPRAVWVAVSVLIVTCPCALSLAAPSALLAAARRLARRGVLLQRLDALDALASVRRLFVDKTGTLTVDVPRLASAHALDGGDAAPLLERAASLASWSRHPLSRALVDAVPGAAAGQAWSQPQERPGQGVQATDGQGRVWRLGRREWVEDGDSPALDDGTALQAWFGPRGRALLRLDFDETLREDALRAVQSLRAQGVAVSLLSGDAPARVARMAALLGLDEAQGAATPEDKLRALRAAQIRGECVAMLGDGVNDAPVLAQADASFAMGQGAVVARAHADAVVLSMRLADVADALALARRARAVVRQNMGWALAYNAACIPLALAGWLPPWAAGIGMAASSLLVVANALRLAR